MTVSLREEQAQWIEAQIGENGEYESKSEVMRSVMDRHQELHDEVEDLEEVIEAGTGENEEYESLSDAIEALMAHHDELQSEVKDLETQVERLEREKRMILEQREENIELVRYVEDELSYREASLGTRMRWWLFGKS